MPSFLSVLAVLGAAVSVVTSQAVYVRQTIQPPIVKNVTWKIPGTSLTAVTPVRGYGLNKRARPLVVLHGGPGIPSNYLTPLIDLASSMPVYIYDQVGCGASSHFANQMGNTSFWTEDLFVAEFYQVIKQVGIAADFAVYGHSWGGQLASRIGSERPAGLKKIVMSSAPITIPLWLESAATLRSQLPQEYQDALNVHEADGTTDDPEYVAAVQYFYDLHVLRIVPNPADVLASFAGLGEDPTVYFTMNGPNEFSISGPLKDWDGTAYGKKINVPTLIINGKYDEGQDICIEPWTKVIANSKWVTFQNSSHMGFWEERTLYIATLRVFLA